MWCSVKGGLSVEILHASSRFQACSPHHNSITPTLVSYEIGVLTLIGVVAGASQLSGLLLHMYCETEN
jgi:hypothetical protein